MMSALTSCSLIEEQQSKKENEFLANSLFPEILSLPKIDGKHSCRPVNVFRVKKNIYFYCGDEVPVNSKEREEVRNMTSSKISDWMKGHDRADNILFVYFSDEHTASTNYPTK